VPRRDGPQRGGPGLSHAHRGGAPESSTDEPRTYYIGVVVDVTAQQRYERELGELVDRYRLLTESPPMWSSCTRTALRLRQPAMADDRRRHEEAYARGLRQVTGHLSPTSWIPADIPARGARLSPADRARQFFEHGEVRCILPNGTPR